MIQYSFKNITIDSKIEYEPRMGDKLGPIEIRNSEGDGIPHIHIDSVKLGGKICLRLDSPLYLLITMNFLIDLILLNLKRNLTYG